MPHKIKQFLTVLVKMTIVIGAFYFIYSKLVENENLELAVFLTFLKENHVFSPKTIIILISLTILNWFFEILKWRNLVNILKKISFKSALEQSLAGQTASLMTPNRIGDYGAKVIYFSKPFRKKIVLLNLLGNMSQMMITTIFGILGLIIFVNRYPINVAYNSVLKLALIILIVGLFLLIAFQKNKFKIKGYSIKRIFDFVNGIPTKKHLQTVLFSCLRYLIFSFQFYYLLYIFGVDISYSNAMVVITSMYFLASIVPSISIFDVVIKGSVALFLFAYLNINELTILSITSLMWLLNVMIPTIFGSYFVLNFKLPKAKE